MVASKQQSGSGEGLGEGDGVNSSFHFMRMQPDGRLTATTVPQTFSTIDEAKAAAPDLLVRMRPGSHGSRVVLVQVLEEARFSAMVVYEKWSEATRRKHGV